MLRTCCCERLKLRSTRSGTPFGRHRPSAQSARPSNKEGRSDFCPTTSSLCTSRLETAQSAYWTPVLAVLRDAPGHRLTRADLRTEFYKRMRRVLKTGDLVAVDSSGEERWRVLVNFAIQHLKAAMLTDSPERGSWRVTAAGLKRRSDDV